jgi:hypothetical protein
MRTRALARTVVFVGVTTVILSSPSIALGGQAPAQASGRRFAPPRTAEGRPDLQGTWNYASTTPLERPESMKGKPFLEEAEAAELVKRSQAQRTAADSAPARAGDVGAYNQFWMDPGSASPDRRTSLITDPPDGRLPALTPEAQKRAAVHKAQLAQPAEGPEVRDAAERCIVGFNSGPPMVPVGYNQNMQLVQTLDNVVVFMEMVHDARIVPLTTRPSLPSHVRPWLGDSRGRWEGDTLVVQTTNFSDRVWNQFNGWNWASDENMKLTERFTLVAADMLQYEFTVDDPTTWTKPWSVAILLSRSKDQIYEYACHEGNHGMVGILRGARGAERLVREGTKAP